MVYLGSMAPMSPSSITSPTPAGITCRPRDREKHVEDALEAALRETADFRVGEMDLGIG